MSGDQLTIYQWFPTLVRIKPSNLIWLLNPPLSALVLLYPHLHQFPQFNYNHLVFLTYTSFLPNKNPFLLALPFARNNLCLYYIFYKNSWFTFSEWNYLLYSYFPGQVSFYFLYKLIVFIFYVTLTVTIQVWLCN